MKLQLLSSVLVFAALVTGSTLVELDKQEFNTKFQAAIRGLMTEKLNMGPLREKAVYLMLYAEGYFLHHVFELKLADAAVFESKLYSIITGTLINAVDQFKIVDLVFAKQVYDLKDDLQNVTRKVLMQCLKETVHSVYDLQVFKQSLLDQTKIISFISDDDLLCAFAPETHQAIDCIQGFPDALAAAFEVNRIHVTGSLPEVLQNLLQVFEENITNRMSLLRLSEDVAQIVEYKCNELRQQFTHSCRRILFEQHKKPFEAPEAFEIIFQVTGVDPLNPLNVLYDEAAKSLGSLGVEPSNFDFLLALNKVAKEAVDKRKHLDFMESADHAKAWVSLSQFCSENVESVTSAIMWRFHDLINRENLVAQLSEVGMGVLGVDSVKKSVKCAEEFREAFNTTYLNGKNPQYIFGTSSPQPHIIVTTRSVLQKCLKGLLKAPCKQMLHAFVDWIRDQLIVKSDSGCVYDLWHCCNRIEIRESLFDDFEADEKENKVEENEKTDITDGREIPEFCFECPQVIFAAPELLSSTADFVHEHGRHVKDLQLEQRIETVGRAVLMQTMTEFGDVAEEMHLTISYVFADAYREALEAPLME